MDLGIFTWITGIATLLGFLLQVRDVLPKYRETRKALLLVTLGIFIGTIIGSLQRVSIQFNMPITGFSLLIGFMGILLAVLVLIGVFTNDTRRREDVLPIAGVGTVVFIFVLFFGYLLTSIDIAPHTETQRKAIAIDELLLLVDVNVEKRNIDRAIMLLEQTKGRLQETDPRYAVIESRIEALKKEQVSPTKQKPGS
jgi:hypothetical protein